MFRTQSARPPIDVNEEFDLIVVGSGNGACGFLGECLKHVHLPEYRILVLEEGDDFFYTSDITHQNGWSKTYSSGRIFTLHNALTPNNIPVLSGRARTMGGGGSINYTMIHESSEWLARQTGRDVVYWDGCKNELNASLRRPDPFDPKLQTPFANYIAENAQRVAGYAAPTNSHMIENIPSYYENSDDEASCGDKSKQLYIFPTQFNQFGSRTNSGVSLIQWDTINYRCRTKVMGLVMEKNSDEYSCVGVRTKCLESHVSTTYKVKKETGRVVLCGGSQSPRLLLQTKELVNEKIGTRINDHICMPLAIYMISKDQAPSVGPTDNYESLFGTMQIRRHDGSCDDEGEQVALVNFDFFSGDILRLVYLISSLYLCYIPFNGFKRLMGRYPIIFTYLSNIIRVLITGLVYIIEFLACILPFLPRSIKITTALVKFNASREGFYEKKGDKIILRFFEDDSDFAVAEEAINQNIAFLESNGTKPCLLFRWVFQLLTKIPYNSGREVKRYVRRFARKTLLSEQHLAGGCLLGDVVDKGLEDNVSTGKVFGSANVYVADLSIVPLPRVSTQMTAYLMGHHVAKQLYSNKKKD